MKKISYYWGELKNSFYNPSFYNDVENRSLPQIVRFLIAICLASTLLFTLVGAVVAVPKLINLSNSDIVEKNYPNDLVVTIKDGIATSNADEPFKIPLSREHAEREKLDNMVVINTSDDLSLEEIASYQSFVVVMKDKVAFTKSSDETRIFSLKEVKDLVINEENVKAWYGKGVFWLRILALPLALVMVALVVTVSVLWYMFIALALACVTLLYAKFRKHTMTYTQAYKVSLYTIGPIVVLDAVAMLFGMMSLPLILTLLVFAVTIVANVARNTEPVQSDSTSPLT